MVTKRAEEKTIKTIQSSQVVNRYKSLKTMPSKSSIYGESINYRRMLVNPSPAMAIIDRRGSLERRELKYDRKRQSPRREPVHRCESY